MRKCVCQLPFSDGLFPGRTGGHCNRADVNMYRDFTAAYNEGRLKTLVPTMETKDGFQTAS